MAAEQEIAMSKSTENSSSSEVRTPRGGRGRRGIFWGILGVLVVVVGFQAWFLRDLRQELATLKEQHAVLAEAPDLSLDLPANSASGQAWNPFEEMERMHSLMNQAFDRSLTRFRQHPMMSSIVSEEIAPKIDVREEPDRFVVTADVPGAKTGSVKVDLTGQRLTIEGSRESQNEETDANGQIIRQEREAGLYSRAVILPEPVAAADMKTDLEDGVLTITIPKASHS